ncbi:glycosyltransferase involved in cell wall biosynthesis [Aequitasia blattaphilus]|uniref:Glycosyltransferase family 4 protein n=1 Tax=Aequitasia blattaphilus TaxID=2949332 RepID=A0ABT1E6B3_9FIRM|nr:glycosyltransferase family 4 protein [Aequitasia blattaphilus]MCP1101370.1 glycosyltransferase family 4 protein [Aequitasia blattaphilus]MCR8614010.1 glycosyltransferase family 4 protein [Aequitasia blattaphilus]
MTYCIFAAQFLPHMGGVERYVYNLSKKLIENGERVIVVTSHMDENLPYQENMEGIVVYRIPSIPAINERFPIPKNWKKVMNRLDKEKIDFIVVNARFYLLSILGLRYGKKRKIPQIVIEHGSGHLSVHHSVLDSIGGFYEHFHTAIVKRYCKDFYGVSEACNEWLDHFRIKGKGTIYNSISLEELEESKVLSPHYRKELKIDASSKVVIFTGRLLKEKGILQLVESIIQLKKDGYDVHLLIAGTGDLEEEIRKIKNENIHLLGYLSHEEVLCMLREGNIYCLPSDSEGFSSGVLEASACDCYIITTRRGGSKELISSPEYGMILEDNKQESVYNGLRYILDHPEEEKSAIGKAHKRVLNEFTWNITTRKLMNIAESMRK